MNRRFAHNISIFLLDLILSVISSVFALLVLRVIYGEILYFNRLCTIWLLTSLLATVAGILISGSFRVVVRHSTLKSVNKIIVSTLCKGLFFLMVWLLGTFHHFGVPVSNYFWILLLLDLMLSFILPLLTRLLIINAYDSFSRDYAEEVKKVPVVVYGTSNKAVAMVTRLSTSPNYNVIGFISPLKANSGLIIHDLPVYTYSDEASLADLRNRLGFECVLFADHDAAEAARKDELSLMCVHSGIHVLNTPRIAEAHFGSLSGEALKAVSNQEMILDGMSSFGRITKRIADCALSGLLLIIFSPLILICFLAIKLDDKGPAIYKQERIGRFGRPFNIYKFRSMRTDAEAAGPALYSGDDDPRLTKVGKFLRVHHLDELPQLWNVFMGDMSFIGWRPERKFYIDQIMEQDPRYYYLYQIRPGVTSYATLKNGYTDTMEKMLRRLEFDLYYLRHRSWWFDIKILFQTFVSIVFGKKF